MKIASWNVNSIRTRIIQVIDWINIKNPDVLCLQETKVIDEDFPTKPFKDLGYEVVVFGQKSYNGVAILSRIPIHDVKLGFLGELKNNEQIIKYEDQKRIISVLINEIRIINVYVPNGSSPDSEKFEYKLKWLEHFSEYLNAQEKRNENTCIVGDFNIAPTNNDLHTPDKHEGSIMATKIERETLKNLLNKRFIDSFRVFEKNYGFWSWWDYRNNAFALNKGWRIDHIYISNNLLSNLKSSVIDSSPRGNIQPSDHAPVMIS